MSKHTPGPWRIEQHSPKERAGIESVVCPFSVIIFGHRNQDDCGIHGRNKAEENANANLIAAAPDMLEALEFARALLGAMPISQIDRAHQRSAVKLNTEKAPREYLSEVIEKAKGETQ